MFDNDATVVVGRFAKDSAIAEPEKAVEFVQRHMGNPNGADHQFILNEILARQQQGGYGVWKS